MNSSSKRRLYNHRLESQSWETPVEPTYRRLLRTARRPRGSIFDFPTCCRLHRLPESLPESDFRGWLDRLRSMPAKQLLAPRAVSAFRHPAAVGGSAAVAPPIPDEARYRCPFESTAHLALCRNPRCAAYVSLVH